MEHPNVEKKKLLKHRKQNKANKQTNKKDSFQKRREINS